MEKWADFGISAVRFNSRHTHIDKVQVRPDNGDSFGSVTEYSRSDVVAAIKRGVTFITIFRNDKGSWMKGQPVFIVVIRSAEYIKTVKNDKEVDNLDDLPEF